MSGLHKAHISQNLSESLFAFAVKMNEFALTVTYGFDQIKWESLPLLSPHLLILQLRVHAFIYLFIFYFFCGRHSSKQVSPTPLVIQHSVKAHKIHIPQCTAIHECL